MPISRRGHQCKNLLDKNTKTGWCCFLGVGDGWEGVVDAGLLGGHGEEGGHAQGHPEHRNPVTVRMRGQYLKNRVTAYDFLAKVDRFFQVLFIEH